MLLVKTLLLKNISATIVGFEELKHYHDNDADCRTIFAFLMDGSTTCLPKVSLEWILMIKIVI